MIPPRTKSYLKALALKYVSSLQAFKNSNPVVMIGQTKFDRVDQKVVKEAIKLSSRQTNTVKLQGTKKKYEKRKPAITYRSYTVQFKKRLVKKIRELHTQTGYPLSKIIRSKARELNIHPKNIFRWFNTKQIKKKQGGRKAKYPQMQKRLAQFILNNPKMKRKQILRQAHKIMQDLRIPGRQRFNFSKGWYERFRERMVKRKILPKIQAKNQQGQLKYQDQSDFSSSQSSLLSVKKQQFLQKQEFIDVKMQPSWSDWSDQSSYQSESFYDSDDQYRIKQAKKEEVTEIERDPFLINYDEFVIDQLKEVDQKEQKLQKKCQSKKQQKHQKESLLKEEQKTFEREGDGSFQIPSNQSSKNKIEVSIFASDEDLKS